MYLTAMSQQTYTEFTTELNDDQIQTPLCLHAHICFNLSNHFSLSSMLNLFDMTVEYKDAPLL